MRRINLQKQFIIGIAVISFNEFGDPLKNVIVIKIKNGKKYYYKTIKP